MHPEHVDVERERSQGFLFGPAHPADADTEALGRRLQRGRRVATESEAEAQDVALQAGQPLDGVAHPLVDHRLFDVGDEVGVVGGHEVAQRRRGLEGSRLVE